MAASGAFATGPAAAYQLPPPTCQGDQLFDMEPNSAAPTIQADNYIICTSGKVTALPASIYRLTPSGDVLVASGSGAVYYVCNSTVAPEAYQVAFNNVLYPSLVTFYCD
jgi:hypothetical protein